MAEAQGPYEQFEAALTVENRFEPPKALAAYYQATFNHINGREVLADMLAISSVFDFILAKEPGDIYRHNQAIRTLELLGVIKRSPDGQILNMRQIVDSLLNTQEGRTNG